LPIWLRFVLLVGVLGLASGACLLAYRYYTYPVTLSVAVGSIDGEAANAMSAIASRLVATSAPVRFKVIDSGTALEAAKTFAAGKADLAVVRGDVGDLSQAQAVVVVSHMVALIIAPPGSTIDGVDKLKGRRVGVLGGDANSKIVDVLSKEYGLDRAKVFKDIALPDARRAIQSKEVSALLVVIPLAEKYLRLRAPRSRLRPRGALRVSRIRSRSRRRRPPSCRLRRIPAGRKGIAGARPDRLSRGNRTDRTRL